MSPLVTLAALALAAVMAAGWFCAERRARASMRAFWRLADYLERGPRG